MATPRRNIVYVLTGVPRGQEPEQIITPTGQVRQRIRDNLYGRSTGRVRREYVLTGTTDYPETIQTPTGATAYYNPRTQTYATSWPRTGRAYSSYSERTQARLDRLIAKRQNQGVSREQSLRDLRSGNWQPLARRPRILPDGRANISEAVLRTQSIDTLRGLSDDKARQFYDYLLKTDIAAAARFNSLDFQARRDQWSTQQHVTFLSMTYGDYQDYVRDIMYADQRTRLPGNRTNLPLEFYHGV